MAKPKYTCILDRCDKPAYKGRMCLSHKTRLKNTGSLVRPCTRCGDDIPVGTPGNQKVCEGCRVCTIPGCGRLLRKNGFCEGHSGRYENYGSPHRPCGRCGKDLPLSAKPSQKICESCRVCKVPGCENRYSRNGYCSGHYSRSYINGSPYRTCPTCQGEVPLGIERYGHAYKFCSEGCVTTSCAAPGCDSDSTAKGYCPKHYWRIHRNGSIFRECKGCGGKLPDSVISSTQYCDDSCRPRCLAPECIDPATDATGWCARHTQLISRYGELRSLDFTCIKCGKFVERSYADRHQMGNRTRCDDCTNHRRDHDWYRREVLSGMVPAICGICGEGINLSLKFPDLRSLTIDHIVPSSKGGSSERRNLQPAHNGCNLSKGGSIARPLRNVLTLF